MQRRPLSKPAMAATATSAPRDIPSFAPVLRPDGCEDEVDEDEAVDAAAVKVFVKELDAVEEAEVVELVLVAELLVASVGENIR
jgi:hypothetical protein